MTRSEWVLMIALYVAVAALMTMFIDSRIAHTARHQFACCFAPRHNLAYPCHENPHWAVDL